MTRNGRIHHSTCEQLLLVAALMEETTEGSLLLGALLACTLQPASSSTCHLVLGLSSWLAVWTTCGSPKLLHTLNIDWDLKDIHPCVLSNYQVLSLSVWLGYPDCIV